MSLFFRLLLFSDKGGKLVVGGSVIKSDNMSSFFLNLTCLLANDSMMVNLIYFIVHCSLFLYA